MGPGGWAVTLVLSVALSVVGAYWLRWVTMPDLVAGLCEAIPPVPAVAVLILLIAVRGLVRALGSRFKMTTVQIVTIYAFVSVSVPIGFVNFYRQVLNKLTAPTYGTQPALSELKNYVPGWLAPTDEVVVTHYWEGSPTGAVPWKEWLIPLLSIGGTILVFYVVIICMLRLLHRRWSSEERLIYPIAQLALSMVEEGEGGGSGGSIFRSPVFWVGGATALAFNLIYIIPALHPGWPVPPVYIQVSNYLVDPPWNAAGLWQLRLNPVVFGLGFLVSTDVLLTIWTGFLVLKFQAIFLNSLGVPVKALSGIEYQQGLGAYAAVAILTLWAARHHLLRAIRRLLPGSARIESDEAGRWTVVLLVAGIGGLLWIMMHAGMVLWLAVAFLVLLLVRSLVLARIRAQTGVPQIYLHVAEPNHMVWLIGGAALAAAGMRSIAALVLMSFVVSATYLVPHHADAFKLAERSGLGVRRWAFLAVFAAIVGLIVTNLTHLPAYYRMGAVNIVGWQISGLEGHARSFLMPAAQGAPVEKFKVAMAVTGFLTTCVLSYFRGFHWFPFHPAGYVVACAIGYRVWAPIFLIWFIKWTILRYFGGRLHRKAKIYFLGLVIGQFALATIWGILAMTGWPPTERFHFAFW